MTNYVTEVKNIFNKTSMQPFMGGKLEYCRFIDDNILEIKSQYRMDANMMVTLQKFLKGTIIKGNNKGNLLHIKLEE